MQEKIPFALTAVVFILIGILSFQNMEAVSFQLFGAKNSMPLACLLSSSFILGLIPGIGFMFFRKQKKVVAKAIEEKWDKDDEKLAKEIGSDKVKQLEAKIETLETALKAALAKKK